MNFSVSVGCEWNKVVVQFYEDLEHLGDIRMSLKQWDNFAERLRSAGVPVTFEEKGP